ncbi:MAG TPA: tetratricopeptide repeat protein, partial [Longimicrobiaceae bacterium]|nr:tetratricopeptide repeat protein [Longimicrobiaceae bacterium]
MSGHIVQPAAASEPRAPPQRRGAHYLPRVDASPLRPHPARKSPSRHGTRHEPLPPPRSPREGGRLDRADLLAELPGDAGLLLWRVVRAVALWAEDPRPGASGTLFAPGAAARLRAHLQRSGLEPQAQAAVAEIAAWMDDPSGLSADQLVRVCRVLSAWAEERGSLATAFEFAQAAAWLEPGAAMPAYLVGRLARRMGEYALAESWLRYALHAARGQRNWRAYTLAWTSIGNVFWVKGNLERARVCQLRALRSARRHSLRQSEAEALHALFVVLVALGCHDEAEQRGREAMRAYGPEHPKLPRLRNDLSHLLVLRGRFAEALETADDLPRHFRNPAERIAVLGLTALAAGGAGDRARFALAAAEVEALAGAEASAE